VRRKKPWRWFKVRLIGLMGRDTPTAILLATDRAAPEPARRTSPAEVGAVLEAWSRNGKG